MCEIKDEFQQAINSQLIFKIEMLHECSFCIAKKLKSNPKEKQTKQIK